MVSKAVDRSSWAQVEIFPETEAFRKSDITFRREVCYECIYMLIGKVSSNYFQSDVHQLWRAWPSRKVMRQVLKLSNVVGSTQDWCEDKSCLNFVLLMSLIFVEIILWFSFVVWGTERLKIRKWTEMHWSLISILLIKSVYFLVIARSNMCPSVCGKWNWVVSCYVHPKHV